MRGFLAVHERSRVGSTFVSCSLALCVLAVLATSAPAAAPAKVGLNPDCPPTEVRFAG